MPEKRSYPEEIAYRLGYIVDAQVQALASRIQRSSYGQYLLRMLEDKVGSA